MSLRLDERLAGTRASNRLALGLFLVPGYPDWPTSRAARDMAQDAGVDFIEYPVCGAGAPSERTGTAVAEALGHLGADAYETSARYIEWINGLQAGVAVVYEAAWPTPKRWTVDVGALAPARALLLEWTPGDLAARADAARTMAKPLIPALSAADEIQDTFTERLALLRPPFVYVSLGEKTGHRTASFSDLAGTVARLRAAGCASALFAAFGLGNPQDISSVARAGADGAIVGSHALAVLAEGLDPFRKWLRELCAAARQPEPGFPLTPSQ